MYYAVAWNCEYESIKYKRLFALVIGISYSTVLGVQFTAVCVCQICVNHLIIYLLYLIVWLWLKVAERDQTAKLICIMRVVCIMHVIFSLYYYYYIIIVYV